MEYFYIETEDFISKDAPVMLIDERIGIHPNIIICNPQTTEDVKALFLKKGVDIKPFKEIFK